MTYELWRDKMNDHYFSTTYIPIWAQAGFTLSRIVFCAIYGIIDGFMEWLSDLHRPERASYGQVELQLSREPRGLPQMKLNPEIKNIFDFTFDDFSLENYDPHPAIKGKVAV